MLPNICDFVFTPSRNHTQLLEAVDTTRPRGKGGTPRNNLVIEEIKQKALQLRIHGQMDLAKLLEVPKRQIRCLNT